MKARSATVSCHSDDNKLRKKKADCASRYNDRLVKVINHHPLPALERLFVGNDKVIRIDGVHNQTCGVFYGPDRLSTTGVIIAIRTLGVPVISA